MEASPPIRASHHCCYNCGSADHLNRDCPEGKSKPVRTPTFDPPVPLLPSDESSDSIDDSADLSTPTKLAQYNAERLARKS